DRASDVAGYARDSAADVADGRDDARSATRVLLRGLLLLCELRLLFPAALGLLLRRELRVLLPARVLFGPAHVLELLLPGFVLGPLARRAFAEVVLRVPVPLAGEQREV